MITLKEMLEGKADYKLRLREELRKIEEAETYFGKKEAFEVKKKELKRRLTEAGKIA